MIEFAKRMDEIKAEMDRLREELARELLAVPDNPKIRRLAANAFVISSADLGSNWSPDFHDHKAQGRWLADAVLRAVDPIEFLNDVVLYGKARDSAEKRVRYFAPEVAAYVKSLI